MHQANIALLATGLLLLTLGLAAGWLKSRSFLSEPLIALVVGVLLGPLGFGWLRPQAWGDQFVLMEEVARVTLALSLVTSALRLPRGYIRGHLKPFAMMLLVVMPLSWLVMGALGFWLGLPLLSALLVGAVAAPTDPVLASSIVEGGTASSNIPARLRFLLTAESGANDGLAFPLALLPILLMRLPARAALGSWLLHIILWEVIGAALVGALIGALGGRLLAFVRPGRPDAIHLTSVSAIAFVTLAATKLLGADGVFAVFAAGVALKTTDPRLEKTQVTQEAINRLFNLLVFALLGMTLPWREWLALGWTGVALAVGALVLRRLPLVLALRPWIAPLQRPRDALLLGWFGPIGVGALFYAILGCAKPGALCPGPSEPCWSPRRWSRTASAQPPSRCGLAGPSAGAAGPRPPPSERTPPPLREADSQRSSKVKFTFIFLTTQVAFFKVHLCGSRCKKLPARLLTTRSVGDVLRDLRA